MKWKKQEERQENQDVSTNMTKKAIRKRKKKKTRHLESKCCVSVVAYVFFFPLHDGSHASSVVTLYATLCYMHSCRVPLHEAHPHRHAARKRTPVHLHHVLQVDALIYTCTYIFIYLHIYMYECTVAEWYRKRIRRPRSKIR